jgi:hypothetical protein
MRSGGCQCGEIRYEVTGEAIGLYICHCLECQKQSASAFGITYEVTQTEFKVIKGIPKYWVRDTDSGLKLRCAFCPTCGSRVWHDYGPSSKTISIKGGSLDEPVDVTNAVHVWVKRKLPGIVIPDGVKQISDDG